MNIKVMCLLPLCSTVADRVGLRTVDACEPRQIRKEAAAAGYARVAVLSGSVSSFFLSSSSPPAFCPIAASEMLMCRSTLRASSLLANKHQAR